MEIHIVAGGPFNCIPPLTKKNNEHWIAVDGGLDHIIKNDFLPDFLIGDFDSTKALYMEGTLNIPYLQFPSHKDVSDLELAIEHAIIKKPSKIYIYGATGGRLDHMLVNVQLLLKGLEANVEIFMIDRQNKMTLKKPGRYTISRSQYRYVSFLPLLKNIEKLTLHGFKYPLENQLLQIGSSLCVSNELVNKEGTFSFSSGILLVIESND